MDAFFYEDARANAPLDLMDAFFCEDARADAPIGPDGWPFAIKK
jgi:hypothetical protein